jgi:long-chain acyl-CoA synthetase
MLNEDGGIRVRDAEANPSTSPSTLPEMLLESARKHRTSCAFKCRIAGHWVDISTDEFLLRVEAMAFALLSLGVKPGERIAILSENRIEWAIADYAGLCIGANIVPIYPTLAAAQIEGLLRDSEPVVIFVSTAELFRKLWSIRRPNGLGSIICFEPALRSADERRVIPIDALYDIGRKATYDYPGEFYRRACEVAPEDVATIIYTSGTTGVPKGVMLTHRNLISNIVASSEILPLTSTDLGLSFLPLSHIFQRHVDYASMYAGAAIAYSGNTTSVAEDMAAVRPTFAAGVPRFFEKMYARTIWEVSQSPAVKRAVFDKALRIGRDHLRAGKSSIWYRAADRFVFSRIRERLGGRIRLFISGGAALAKEVAEFFWTVGLPIYEGYGLTETSPVITLNGPDAFRLGSVGAVIGDQEVRIAEDGEILVRGSNVMKGYYNMPGETAEALDRGWFHTGDIGDLDSAGFLHITDRKKDLIVTSGGKNVAPQPIENRLKMIPYFDNVVLIGDRRNFISALITPNYDALAAFARQNGIPFENPSELVDKPEIYELAMREIEQQTQDLSDFEKVRKIAFLDRQFSIDAGELTPTLKVRRFTIEKKYRTAIDELYAA